MNKQDIQENDILEFANGEKLVAGKKALWILRDYYNDNLTCKTNAEYDIIRVYRPTYELIYGESELKR